MEGVALGPFLLERCIGQGGMAEVWRAVHAQQGVAVAVKVITHQRAHEPSFQAAFRNEVQSVARLHHRHTILVLDYGLVDAAAQEATRGHLVAGSPYLAMELASGGTLSCVRRPLPWNALRTILVSLLDALAHAHARGVIHRDLKPANVLWCSAQDVRPGLKITDFGLAHPLDDDRATVARSSATGTPLYMAPEQFLNAWRDFGPWTDLYALGCTAFELATGVPPFTGSVTQLALDHCHHSPPVPRLPPDYPAAFLPWLLRLLDKDLVNRFATVADAAFALHQADRDSALASQEQVEALFSGKPPPSALLPTMDLGSTSSMTLPDVEDAGLSPTLHWPVSPAVPAAGGHADALPSAAGPSSLPPLPLGWRLPEGDATSIRLLGAGLGLYGLRPVPFVNRDEARDAVWKSLRAVRETGRMRVVVLQGVSGTGKSRLAEWMCQRALEVGAAAVLRAVHGPEPSPSQGLERMLAQWLSCRGLPREELLARVHRLLPALGVTDPFDTSMLAELLLRTEGGESSPVAAALSKGRERHAVMRRVLQQAARQRPLVLWLDDVQWGLDALGLVQHLLELEGQARSPILVLLTVQEEALQERAAEKALLARLASHAAVETVALRPLDAAHHRQLVEELLGLEGTLVREVAERTAGNPLFAVQLVGDWVQRGVLRAGTRGFVRPPGTPPALPDSLHEVWHARVEQVLERHGSPARLAMELAAVLGMHVDKTEWSMACRVEGLEVPTALVNQMLDSRLLVRIPGGFRFVHGMLKESFERDAAAAGRLEKHHAAAVRVLLRVSQAGVEERLGRHEVAAGMLPQAHAHLLQGARARLRANEYAAAHALLDLREDALRRLDLPVQHVHHGEGWVLRAQVLAEEDRLAEGVTVAARAVEGARDHAWSTLLGPALAALAQAHYQRGDIPAARQGFAEALEEFERAGDRAGVARCQRGVGDAEYRLGHFPEAEEHYQRALAAAEQADHQEEVALNLWGLGYVALWRQDLACALEHFEAQMCAFRALGSRYGMALTHNALGEVYRLRGDHEGAEAHYRQAVQISDSLGAAGRYTPLLNLMMIMLERGELDRLGKELQRAWADLSGHDSSVIRCGALALRTAVCAHEGDWAAWDYAADALARLLKDCALADVDIALALVNAAGVAAPRKERLRARQAWELGVGQLRALGRLDLVARAEERWQQWGA